MKIRIRDNSLRLRLSQTEVQEFQSVGLVRASIRFGVHPTDCLLYTLRQSNKATLSAHYSSKEICVDIPHALALEWAGSSMVSLRSEQDIGNEECLSILIEKDFKCLKERLGEDERDLFPNPDEHTASC